MGLRTGSTKAHCYILDLWVQIMASMSIFPLTYLGQSLIQQTREDELETIYEVLLTHYLNFLRRVISDGKSIVETLSESFETVIMAIGNGQFTIRTTETERYGDQKIRKHFEKRFTSDQLIYFNCYYFEVVTPMGRDERKCFAYFRRAIDTRRCVPEDALVQLDGPISQWLLRNRHLTRPPLLYCIVANKEAQTGLDCYVFLADNVQVGLRVVRSLAELRQSMDKTPGGLKVAGPDKRYHSPRRYASKRQLIRSRQSDQAGMITYSPRSRSTDSHLHRVIPNHCPGCLVAGDHNYYVNMRNQPRICRSHTDLLHSWTDRTHCSLCDVYYCAYCGEPMDSSSSTSDSEGKKRRLLQMKLGKEALDYYERRKRQTSSEIRGQRRYRRDRSVPTNIEQHLGRLNLNEETSRESRSKNHINEVPGRVAMCPHHRPVGSAGSRSSRTFLNSSLSMLP